MAVFGLLVPVCMGLSGPAAADIVTLSWRGQIATVDEFGGPVLDGSIAPGTPFTLRYTFDTATGDISPDPTVGHYRQTNPGLSMRVEAGSYVFESDPARLDYFLVIVDRNHDNYLVGSGNNQVNAPGLIVEPMTWQLDDPSGTASQGDGLPSAPPNLSQWLSFFGVSIQGGAPDPLDPTRVDPMRRFFIRGHVEALDEQPPPPPAGCSAVFTCIANATPEQRDMIRGPEGLPGPQGPEGATGPGGPAPWARRDPPAHREPLVRRAPRA
jgi:hypothetical protein